MIETGSAQGLSPLACIIPFFGLMAVLVVATVLYVRKQSREVQAAARQLGFTLLGKPEERFLERLREIYRPARLVRMSNLAKKVEGIGSLYLFDTMTASPWRSQGSRSSGDSETCSVGILSPDLDLPPFFLIGRMPVLGPLGDKLNDLIAMAAGQAGYSEWEIVPPDFNRCYQLYVRDDPRNPTVFTDEALSRIAQTEGIVARGDGEFLMVNSMNVRGNTKMDARGLGERVQRARDMYEWLRR